MGDIQGREFQEKRVAELVAVGHQTENGRSTSREPGARYRGRVQCGAVVNCFEGLYV
jgi:hypothetical protein